MKKVLIMLGILMIAVLLVGCKKAEFAEPAAPTAPADETPIDKDMAGLDSELNVDLAGSDLDSLDKDLDNL